MGLCPPQKRAPMTAAILPQLILHLNVLAAALWQQFGSQFRNFGGRRDRVALRKNPCRPSSAPKGTGLVACQDALLTHARYPPIRRAKSGQRSSHSPA